jgi:hypothetical protein
MVAFSRHAGTRSRLAGPESVIMNREGSNEPERYFCDGGYGFRLRVCIAPRY